MQASELRIGNLVQTKHAQSNYQITAKDILDISQGRFPIEPIPITKEWHLKLKDTPIFTDKQGFVIFKNHFAYAFTWDEYPFVHTLQNLYFALTREELTI